MRSFCEPCITGTLNQRASPSRRISRSPRASAPVAIPSALSGAVPPECEVRTLDVQGICCAGCGSKLYGKLAGLDGVREVAVDTLAKKVSTVVRRDVPNATLESALTFDEYVAKAR